MRTFSEQEFKDAVASSRSIREALGKLGLCQKGGGAYRSFSKALKDFKADTSHFLGQGNNKGKTFACKRELSKYLTNEFSIQSHKLRLRLLKDGIFEATCSICFLSEWNGRPIPLELDHKNGKHEDNSLDNLRLLCPNCHAQTPTHAGKNKKQNKSPKLGSGLT